MPSGRLTWMMRNIWISPSTLHHKCVCEVFLLLLWILFTTENIILCFLEVAVTQTPPPPKHWFSWRIRHVTSWHSIIHTRKHEERENHNLNNTAWLHPNDLEEPVEQLENKHSESAIICSNSLSLLKSDLQEAEWHITRQHTPICLTSEALGSHTNIMKVRVMQDLRRAQKEKITGRKFRFNSPSLNPKLLKKKKRERIKFLPEKNSKDKLHWFSPGALWKTDQKKNVTKRNYSYTYFYKVLE